MAPSRARDPAQDPDAAQGPAAAGPLQPRDYEFDFRVILTNKVTDDAEAVMDFHHGRGSQEGLIGEAKSCAQMDYIPSRKLAVNRVLPARVREN